MPSPPPPELPARPRLNPDNADAGGASSSVPEATASGDKARGEDDAVSVLSTSSKSAKFRLPGTSLRRRTTGGTQRSRRASEAASLRSNDDDSTLDPALELEIHGHQRDLGQWGIGDEAQMGLE